MLRGSAVEPHEDEQDNTQAVVNLTPGAIVSRYELIDKLGAGGMGDVYLARDSQLERQIALKFLPQNLAADPMFRERFIREARAAATLNHPNIVTVYEVAETEQRVFIAMEYVPGQSLRQLIDAGNLSLDNSLKIMIQVCEGLGAAHEAGLVHRDVKPLNVIVDESGRVRILDFGLAKVEGVSQLTQAGTTIGTINYMSPEQGTGEKLDHRSDIFAAGVVLYEMITGSLPFSASNMPATIHSIVHDTPASLISHDRSLPHELQLVIDKALAKKPEARYDNMAAMADALKQLRLSQSSPRISAPVIPVSKPAVRALAVLYLRNIGSPDDEFICYGITEDLIVDLTRVGKVRVASMRSILKYKDSDSELEEIAEKLNVGLILDGSIMKTPDTVRVSAQLVDVETGDNLWAQRWEEPTDRLPQIKQSLAEGVSSALDIGHTTVVRAELGKPETANAEAYEYYLKAKYSFENKQSRSDVEIAMGLYALAIKEEPTLLAARAGLAEIMIYNGDLSSAGIELHSALASAQELNRRADEAEIQRQLASYHMSKSEFDSAIKHVQRAITITNELGDLAGEAKARGLLISILQPQARFDDAILEFDRVLEISRELDDQDEIAEALKNMGVTFSRKGEYDRALGLYEESLALAEQRGNLSLQASCLSNIGNIHFFQGELTQAYSQYERALKVAQEIDNKDLASRQEMNMGLVQLMEGQYRDGVQLLESAAASFKNAGNKSTYAVALSNISQARLMLGDVEEAISAANESLEIAHAIGHPGGEADALVQLGSAHFFRREIETATEYYQRALEVSQEAEMTRNTAHIHLAMVNLCFYCKDFKKCRKHATKALSIAREIGEKTASILSKAGLAAVEACEGLYHSGIKQLEDATRGVEKIGNLQMTLQLRSLLGEVLLKHGKSDKDRADGAGLLEDALRIAREKGMAPETKLIEEIKAGHDQQ